MFNLSTHTQEVVLIVVAISVCALTFLHIIDAKDFLVLAGMVFAFYFTNSRDNSSPTPPADGEV